MGNLGVYQVGDMATMYSELGIKAILKTMPLVKPTLKALGNKESYSTPAAFKEFQNELGGWGDTRLMGTGRFENEFNDGMGGAIQHRLDSFKMGVNEINLFNALDKRIRSASVDDIPVKWERYGNGKTDKFGFWSRARLNEALLGPKDAKRLSQSLVKHATLNKDRQRR